MHDQKASCHRDARSQRPADRRNINAEAVDDETSRNNSQLNDGTLSDGKARGNLPAQWELRPAQRELPAQREFACAAGVSPRSGSSALLLASLHLTLHLLQRLPRWLKIWIDPQRRLKFRHRLR